MTKTFTIHADLTRKLEPLGWTEDHPSYQREWRGLWVLDHDAGEVVNASDTLGARVSGPVNPLASSVRPTYNPHQMNAMPLPPTPPPIAALLDQHAIACVDGDVRGVCELSAALRCADLASRVSALLAGPSSGSARAERSKGRARPLPA